MKMMDIRKKILETLDQNPGDMSIAQVARIIGSNSKATNAALSKLYKSGLVVRPQKGLYCSKKRSVPSSYTPPSAPSPSPAIDKRVEEISSTDAMGLTVISVDLLVQGQQSETEARALVNKILLDRSILDARVTNVTDADKGKLQIRVSFAD